MADEGADGVRIDHSPPPEAPTMHCMGCHYPLDGLQEHRCPECGRPFNPAQPLSFYRPRQLTGPRVRIWHLRDRLRMLAWLVGLAVAGIVFFLAIVVQYLWWLLPIVAVVYFLWLVGLAWLGVRVLIEPQRGSVLGLVGLGILAGGVIGLAIQFAMSGTLWQAPILPIAGALAGITAGLLAARQ